jgi:hypothetical protein
MIWLRPVAAARYLVNATVLVLPPDVRDRYRQEFYAELCELGAFWQVLSAADLMRGSLALRQALQDREVVSAPPVAVIDWRCRLGRHHYLSHADDNPEVRGQSVLECTRCGKHEDGPVAGKRLGPAAAGLAFPGIG